MSFDPTPYQFLPGFDETGTFYTGALLHWLIVFGSSIGIVLVVALLTSLATKGLTGPVNVIGQVVSGFRDTLQLSLRRIWALSVLTFKESVRRKALLVFVVFAILFMFGGWFLPNTKLHSDLQVKAYVTFVLTAVSWLILPVVLLLSCWGIPEDIKTRTLHTVVTKPARRNEIVIGRILGFAIVGSLVLAIMGGVGYVWIGRQVPAVVRATSETVDGKLIEISYPEEGLVVRVTDGDEPRDYAASSASELKKQSPEIYELLQRANQAAVNRVLVSRVPIYGDLEYLSREGKPVEQGINVGDPWGYRGYIEGATKARAIWEFKNVDAKHMIDGRLNLEARFESFRTHKGDIEKKLLAQFVLVNDEKKVRIPLRPFEVNEYGENVIELDPELSYTESDGNSLSTAQLFGDVIQDGKLKVEVMCLDAGQYVGMARADLFIRTPDKPFASGYFKAVGGVWLMMVLIVMLGVTASCFVKAPVAALLTFTLIIVGQWARAFMGKIVGGQWQGGGPVESVFRILGHLNPKVPLDEGVATNVIKFVDGIMVNGLWLVQQVIPDFEYFGKMPRYIANGFDVSWNAAMLPGIAITLAYVLPCLLIGHYSLKLRELEAK